MYNQTQFFYPFLRTKFNKLQLFGQIYSASFNFYSLSAKNDFYIINGYT